VGIYRQGREVAMDRIPVQSSNIADVGYEEVSETLEIGFHNGTVYQYMNVPKVVFDQFMESTSKGSFVSANIRNAFASAKQ
jgi:KTSC domain